MSRVYGSHNDFRTVSLGLAHGQNMLNFSAKWKDVFSTPPAGTVEGTGQVTYQVPESVHFRWCASLGSLLTGLSMA